MAPSPSMSAQGKVFHHYLRLPEELQSQIQDLAIEHTSQHVWRHKGVLHGNNKFSQLAIVSKHWQRHVEKHNFKELTIRLDQDNNDVNDFNDFVVGVRRGYVDTIMIGVDDRAFYPDLGPWHRPLGLVDVSLCMEKLGNLLSIVGEWTSESNGRPGPYLRLYLASCWSPGMRCIIVNTPSLWDAGNLNLIKSSEHDDTFELPRQMPLWAIKSSFPSSISVVKELAFLPDFVPGRGGQEILEKFPSLEAVSMGFKFSYNNEDGWEKASELVRQLFRRPTTQPLKRLEFEYSPPYDSQIVSTPAHRNFIKQVRHYSEGLEELLANNLIVPNLFFEPLMGPSSSIPSALSTFQWPNLRILVLCVDVDASSLDDPLLMVWTKMFVGAGRAARAMPSLDLARIKCPTWGPNWFSIELLFKSCHQIKRDGLDDECGIDEEVVASGQPHLHLKGFLEEEEEEIREAWAHAM